MSPADSAHLAVREPAGFIASCVALPKGRDVFRTWTTSSPSPAAWKEKPSASSRTRLLGRSSTTSQSSGTNLRHTSTPAARRGAQRPCDLQNFYLNFGLYKSAV